MNREQWTATQFDPFAPNWNPSHWKTRTPPRQISTIASIAPIYPHLYHSAVTGYEVTFTTKSIQKSSVFTRLPDCPTQPHHRTTAQQYNRKTRTFQLVCSLDLFTCQRFCQLHSRQKLLIQFLETPSRFYRALSFRNSKLETRSSKIEILDNPRDYVQITGLSRNSIRPRTE